MCALKVAEVFVHTAAAAEQLECHGLHCGYSYYGSIWFLFRMTELVSDCDTDEPSMLNTMKFTGSFTGCYKCRILPLELRLGLELDKVRA